MNAQSAEQDNQQSAHGPAVALLRRTALKLWYGRLYSDAAKAAFWQTLSLPPLLLGLLGSVGWLGDLFGRSVVIAVETNIIAVCAKVFSANVVSTIIKPTVEQILTTAQGEIVSVAFVISLWAGSSAMSSFVDAITTAHGQYEVRNPVWQRLYSLLLYLVGLILAVIGLPVIAVGPNLLPRFFPDSWRPEVSALVSTLYYPVLAVLVVLALATLYKVALPRKLPWLRGLPGAVLAMLVFMVASVVLRFYIAQITRTGYSYGALAAPIAFLFFTFAIGLAIVAGAHFNAAIQELWPAKMTRRQRRRWRRLEMERTDEKIRAAQSDDSEGESGTRAESTPEPAPATGIGAESTPAEDPAPARGAESTPKEKPTPAAGAESTPEAEPATETPAGRPPKATPATQTIPATEQPGAQPPAAEPPATTQTSAATETEPAAKTQPATDRQEAPPSAAEPPAEGKTSAASETEPAAKTRPATDQPAPQPSAAEPHETAPTTPTTEPPSAAEPLAAQPPAGAGTNGRQSASDASQRAHSSPSPPPRGRLW